MSSTARSPACVSTPASEYVDRCAPSGVEGEVTENRLPFVDAVDFHRRLPQLARHDAVEDERDDHHEGDPGGDAPQQDEPEGLRLRVADLGERARLARAVEDRREDERR